MNDFFYNEQISVVLMSGYLGVLLLSWVMMAFGISQWGKGWKVRRPSQIPEDGELLSASGSKWVETGIRVFYLLASIAVGLMVYSGFIKILKK